MNAEERGHKNHRVSLRVKVRQNLSKRLKARQMCVDDDDENAISKKPPLLIAQNTQHKLGVRKNYKAYTSKQTFQIGRY